MRGVVLGHAPGGGAREVGDEARDCVCLASGDVGVEGAAEHGAGVG